MTTLEVLVPDLAAFEASGATLEEHHLGQYAVVRAARPCRSRVCELLTW